MRLVAIFLALAGLLLIPFLVFGEGIVGESPRTWLESYGGWAWAPATLLLVGDIVLPVPASPVMAVLGAIYGPIVGGLIGGAGSFAAGCVAYGVCRGLGRGAALRIAGRRDLERGEELFERVGGWAVALTRWLPLLGEVVACMAGLVRMPLAPFLVALACGSLPVGFTYAAVGHAGIERPGLAIALSAALPLLLWAAAGSALRWRARR